VTIGVFDGVHRGHQAIIGHTVERARSLAISSVVVTFDPHPSEVVRPGSHPAVLTESGRKAELIEDLGVDVLCVIPFTLEFSHLSAETFVHDVLVEHLHASEVVVGENFRFGHRAAGDIALLERLGRTFGFTVAGAPLVSTSEQSPVVSSTYIRSCVDAGDVEAAAVALGRPHRLEGIVIRGDRRGREIGFPTANITTSPHAAVPADGVYAAWAVRRGHKEPLRAAVSVGSNPTFAGRERRVEAYLLDFGADIYGERLALDFVSRLREMRRYDGVDPLVEQIHRDVAATRTALP
jgi:riboflavin kinase/FMN adenylyltransferase